jgi:hypothetical protein
MLVSNNVFKNRYVWDGSQTNFPISFPFLDNNHIQVWYAQPGQPDTDAVILGKENYTITGAGNPAGGVLTRTTGWAVGATIAIVRNVPITQLHQYTQYDNFPAESHEDALAKLTMICQQLDEICSRAMTVPVTSEKNPQEYWQDILEQNQIALEASLRAVAAAEQAKTCKTQACQCAQDARDTEARIEAAATGQITAINNAGQTQITEIGNVAATKKNEITAEGNNQISRVSGQGQTEVDRINATGDTRHEEIATLGTQYVNTINGDGSKWVADITNTGSTNITLVNTAGSNAITSITDTGNFQESRIIGVAANAVQDVRQEAQGARQEADRAKNEADRAKAEADRAQQTAIGELPIANHFVQGITRLATTQEHLDATDDTIAATPLGVKQVAQQFVNIVITQPTITGPDSVREQSTHTYSLQAKALLPDAKIVAFYYHIDELGSTPTKVDVPTASQAVEVTLDTDVTFPGNIGTVNTLIVYAEDSYGNLSRYSSKPVEIRLNEPPNMAGFTHTIPANVAKGTTYTIKMSGAVDPDGDPVTYKFDFGDTGIVATPNTGIIDNQNVQFTLPKDNTKYPPSATNTTYVLTFKVIATDSLGATNQVTITTVMSVIFDAPIIGSPRQGQTDFNPKGTVTWSEASIANDVINPDIAILAISETSDMTNPVWRKEMKPAVSSVAVDLPYNKALYAQTRYRNDAHSINGVPSLKINFTTQVVLPKPTFVVTVDGAAVTSGDTTTQSMAEANKTVITVATNTAVPTGETADRVEYQIADNLSFTHSYLTAGAAHTVSSAYGLAIKGGFISGGIPAKATYLRVRQVARQIGPEGYKVDVTSPWSDVFVLNLLSASLTVPVLTSPATGTGNVPKTGITLQWNNGIPVGQTIDKVQVQVATDASFLTIVKDSGAINTVTSWSIIDLALNTTYYWRVRNNGTATGWSAWSNTFNFKTFVNELTSQPPITAPTANQSLISRKNPIAVTWNNPNTANANGSVQYIVNVYDASWNHMYSSGLLGNAVRSFNIPANTLPNADTPYIIQVVATLDGGTSTPAEYNQWKASALTIRTSPPPVHEGFPSSRNWTAPYSGTYRIECVGGGGGAAEEGSGVYSGGGGGGAGGYLAVDVWINAGTAISVTTGAGGIYGSNWGVGGDGGATTVSIANVGSVIAYGGRGGHPGSSTTNAVGGAGGYGGGVANNTAGTVPVFYQGGDGGKGTSFNSYYCNIVEPGTGGMCRGVCEDSTCIVGSDIHPACINIMGTVTINSLAGCGGAICTGTFENIYGGGGGTIRGGDGAQNRTGNPGAAVITSRWTE